MKCIIVDDEPLAIQLLEEYVQRYGRLELVATCANALEAFTALQQFEVELMFLDIRMPGVTGIELLSALKCPPLTVFTTAYDQYAVTGFELNAADYLLKPVTYERFEKSMDRLFKKERNLSPPATAHTYFKVSRDLVKVEHRELIFAQSLKDYILLKTTSAKLITYMTMKSLADLLPEESFIRVHRSYLVNKAFISKIEKGKLWAGAIEIPVGETYKAQLLHHFR
jgi:DNA-binding LytR/AlgR family response regulator